MDTRYMLSEGVELLTTHHKPWKAESLRQGLGSWWEEGCGHNRSLLIGIKAVRLPRKCICFNYI